MRLIAADKPVRGIYHAAAAIEIAADALTYWRQPGEAGVPPKFSFEGSQNLLTAAVQYPAPSRLEEGGVEAFGYRGGVVFPIEVTARDAQEPTILKLSLDFAVCLEICIPVRASADLRLPTPEAEAENDAVAAAERHVPILLTQGDVAAKATLLRRDGSQDTATEPKVGTQQQPATRPTTRPTWAFSWKGETGLVDLFAEAPEGWYFETHKTSDRAFSLIAIESPSAAPAQPIDVRLTAVGAEKSYEFTVSLDPAEPKH